MREDTEELSEARLSGLEQDREGGRRERELSVFV